MSSPFDDDSWVLSAVSSVTGEPIGAVRARLRAEALRPGTNLREEFHRRGLRPHRWDARLESLYRESAAPLYEGIVWNRDPFKRGMRERVARWLEAANRPLDVLCFGDGCGVDSLFLSKLGHRTVYSDLAGPPSRFARRLFEAAEAPVILAADPSALAEEAFDAVLCIDVLEHCPDPPSVVKQLAKRMRSGGALFASAPFHLVTTDYPGHLEAASRYAGDIDGLYGGAGLSLSGGGWAWNPLVLAKGGGDPLLPRASALDRAALRTVGLLLAAGRLTSLPFSLLVESDALRRRALTAVSAAAWGPDGA